MQPLLAVLAVEGGRQPGTLLTGQPQDEGQRVNVALPDHLQRRERHERVIRLAVYRPMTQNADIIFGITFLDL